MSAKQRYEVLETGWLAGHYRRAGDVVEMHPRQAEYFLPPHANRLRPVSDAAPQCIVGAEPPKPRRRR